MRNLREYCRPRTIEEALRLLGREDLRSAILSGGSRLAAGSPDEVERVIDLEGLPLDYVRAESSGLRVGGLTKLQALIDNPAIAGFAGGALSNAARLTASSLRRNLTTLAGTLLIEEFAPELAVLLLVLEAEVLIERLQGADTLPLAGLYGSQRKMIEDGILAEVRVPAPPPGGQIRQHRVARTPSDRAILTVAALTCTTGGVIKTSRLAAAGTGFRPKRLHEIESGLEGKRALEDIVSEVVNRSAAHLELLDDRAASGDYLRSTLQVLIRRAILGD